MKLSKAAAESRGSFGIPEAMRPDAPRKPDTDEPSAQSSGPAASFDDGFEDDGSDEEEAAAPEGEARTKTPSPKKILAEMGVVLSPQDWSDYYYKGYLEKKVIVGQLPQADGTLSTFYATLRTLTGEMGDLADTLLAEEVGAEKMTNDGVSTRREMWNLAFAVQKFNDMPIVKNVVVADPKTKEPKLDLAATAKAKRKVLSHMSPLVLEQLRVKYWTLLTQIRLLMENPKNNFLD
jgi:hypothetical protein